MLPMLRVFLGSQQTFVPQRLREARELLGVLSWAAAQLHQPSGPLAGPLSPLLGRVQAAQFCRPWEKLAGQKEAGSLGSRWT